MPIDLEKARGAKLAPSTGEWGPDQVILYHLGIGAGVGKATDSKELTYTYEKDLKVLPSYGVIPVFGAVGGMSKMHHEQVPGEWIGDDEVGPLLELFAESGVRLGRSGLHLVFGISGRAHLNEGRDWDDAEDITPCDPFTTGEGREVPHSCEAMPPNPVPRFMFDARIGIAWAFGGDRRPRASSRSSPRAATAIRRGPTRRWRRPARPAIRVRWPALAPWLPF